MANRLQDKTIIVTGAGGGIGRASAELFCAEGAQVVGTDLNPCTAQQTLESVRGKGGEMESLHPLNLTSEAACQELIECALQKYGKFDVLYNCAAMAYFDWMPSITADMWNKTINEELNIVFLLCHAAWDHLVSRNNASIINIASVEAHIPIGILPGIAHCAAKGGVLSMTRQLAMEGGKYRLRANSISPGIIVTQHTKQFLTDGFQAAIKQKLMLSHRYGTPEDVAACAVFLASDESGWVTGADFAVDGGTRAW
jgi:NAD(P)-dependent dehydrogenase (short-subunit alcohol dehydrogenase family)